MKVVGEGHGITGVDVPVFLASSTSFHEVLRVFIHGGLVKFTLPYLGMGSECSIVATILCPMTLLCDLDSFIQGHASS